MIRDTQQKLVELRNEIKAQKVYNGLAYSQLLFPENNPVQSYTGTASLSGSGDTPVARLRFRFTRTDGLIEPPFINFAYDASYSPTYQQFAESYGFEFTGRDLSQLEANDITSYIHNFGDGYVDFYIDFQSSMREAFFSLNSMQISATCYAITSVQGTLVMERLI